MTINIHQAPPYDEIEVLFDTKSHTNIENYSFRKFEKGRLFLETLSPRYLFHITLENLQADTTYYFRIGTPQMGYSDEYIFKTASLNLEDYRFVVGGDWETTNSSTAIAKVAASYEPTAMLLGGDYPRDVQSYHDYKKWDLWLNMYTSFMKRKDGSMIPMVLAIGNHEVFGHFDKTPLHAPFYYNYFKQNPKNHSYFYKLFGKDLLIIFLDTGHTERYDGRQLQWLEKTLHRFKDKKVKFAIYHVPLYPSVRFTDETLPAKLISYVYRLRHLESIGEKIFSYRSNLGKKHWIPLFDEYKITTAFEHHDHTLKRTKLLKNGKPSDNGTLFLGDGGMSPEKQFTPMQTFFQNCFAKTIGHLHFFWLAELEKDKIIYRAITDENVIIDEYIQPINAKEE